MPLGRTQPIYATPLMACSSEGSPTATTVPDRAVWAWVSRRLRAVRRLSLAKSMLLADVRIVPAFLRIASIFGSSSSASARRSLAVD